MYRIVKDHFPTLFKHSIFKYPNVSIALKRQCDVKAKQEVAATGKEYLAALDKLRNTSSYRTFLSAQEKRARYIIFYQDLPKLQELVREFEQNINGHSSELLKRRIYFDKLGDKTHRFTESNLFWLLQTTFILGCELYLTGVIILYALSLIHMKYESSLSKTTDEPTPVHTAQSIGMSGSKP